MIQFLQILVLGPLFYIKCNWKISAGLFVVIFVLTVLTQVGGVVLWASLPIFDRLRVHHKIGKWALRTVIFLSLYMVSILLIIPLLAPLGGRVPLPWFVTAETPLKPANIGFCLLGRNYVKPTVRTALERIAGKLSTTYPGTTVLYFDANFPFIDGFPLLPHLSHKDGKKVDLAFFYRDTETKESLNTTPSPIGYWAYEQPRNHELQPCKNTYSWLRWDFDWLQPMFAGVELDPERTQALLNLLITAPEIKKILIEPHLKLRLQVNGTKVRFQGCHAARHDDHIHIQIP